MSWPSWPRAGCGPRSPSCAWRWPGGSGSGITGCWPRRILAHVRFLEASIDDLDTQIDRLIAPFAPMLELVMTIPGVARTVGICLIAEVGVDMTIFPSAGHLASWAGMC